MGFKIELRGQGSAALGRVALSNTAGDEEVRWAVAEEVPVAMVYNDRTYAVMLATPADLGDFALGFSITEQVIGSPADMAAMRIHLSERGADIRMDIAPARLEVLDARATRRNIAGRSGCGACGLDDADIFFRPLPHRKGPPLLLEPGAACRALSQLDDHQPLNRETRSVHAAAFARPDGSIRLAREDVGRHNALDKLLGSLTLNDIDPRDGFVLISSRCSYEMVEKAARCDVGAIASVSGPTGFAIRKADEAGISLYCRRGPDFLLVGAPTGVGGKLVADQPSC